jgi:phage terminase small subunit
MANKFTDKMLAFVYEYPKDFNGTKAAIRAGYSENGANRAASRLLSNVDIQEKIDEEFAKRSLRLDEILFRLTEQATASIGDFVFVNPDGDRIAFDPDVIKEMGHLVKRIKASTTVRYTEKGDQLEYTSLDLTLYDGQKALELLSKHRGMATERIEHTGDVTIRIIRDGDSNASNN